MKLAEVLPERVRTYGKAITAMVFPAVWAYVAVMPNGVTLTEWAEVAFTALAAGGFVAAVPNRLTHEQVERFYEQQEAKYGGIVDAYDDAFEDAHRLHWLADNEVVVNRADFETPGEREAREKVEREERDEPPDGSGKHRRE